MLAEYDVANVFMQTSYSRSSKRTFLEVDKRAWSTKRAGLGALYERKNSAYCRNEIAASSGDSKQLWNVFHAVLGESIIGTSLTVRLVPMILTHILVPRPLGGSGQPPRNTPLLRVTMPNLVALGQTICMYTRGSKNF